MDQSPGFSLSVSQITHLAPVDDEMHAVLVVTADGAGPSATVPELAQVIIVDCSGSMGYPPTKLAAAQRATRAAISILPDGTRFAVIEGDDRARMVYPPEEGLAIATTTTRKAARDAVTRMHSGGTTAIGAWLRLARELLVAYPDAVRHAILLTDGQNTQAPRVLAEELVACAPVFTCDSRGIGEDWAPKELRRIAEALHGSADAIREHDELPDEFRSMTQSAVDKRVPSVRILVRTATLAEISFLRQSFPTMATLEGTADGERVTAFATGSWGSESREFHLCLRVDPTGAELDEKIRVARVDVQRRRPGEDEFENACAPALVFVHWTDNLKLSSVIDPKVAHYTGQDELGRAIVLGCAAHDARDFATATVEWGRAVALATELDNDKALTRLKRLVDVIGDPRDGKVRLREAVRLVDRLSAEMSSVMSSRSPDGDPDRPRESDPPAAAPGPEQECPDCHERVPARAGFCGTCGHRFGGSGEPAR